MIQRSPLVAPCVKGGLPSLPFYTIAIVYRQTIIIVLLCQPLLTDLDDCDSLNIETTGRVRNEAV